MIRIVGVILVMGGASWFGFWAAASLDRERNQLRAAIEALSVLEREMEWDSPPLPELLKRLVGQCEGSMKDIFQGLACSLDSLGEVALAERWSALVAGEAAFSGEMRAALLPLGHVLGRYSSIEQMQAAAKVRARLENVEQRLMEKRDQKGKLYRVLGVSAGSFLVLLLL